MSFHLRRLVLLSCLAGGFSVIAARPAYAIKTFWDEFEKVYINDGEDASDEEKAFAELAAKENKETGSCNVCHIYKESKKLRNTYGMAVSQLLDKDDYKLKRRKEEPEKVSQEIQAALAKANKMRVDGKEVKEGEEETEGETFGDRIAAGKLPGEVPENLEELKEALKRK